MSRPQWLIRLRVWYFTRRARRAMSPLAWAEHRRTIEAASRHDEDRLIDREADAARQWVARLEAAAAVGSQEARQRIKRLRHNPIGTAAARAADAALTRLNAQLTKGKLK